MNNEKQLLSSKRKRAKEEIIGEIENNFKLLEEIFKDKKAQNLFDSIGAFSFEEYSKFFQNLSNKEYTSMSEHPKKNREPISIDKSKIKFDYSIPQNYEELLPSTNDILKTNLEAKGIPKKIKENLNKIIPVEQKPIDISLYLRAVSENISNLINSRSSLEPQEFKQLIKIYSTLIRINDNIYFEQDKLFLELLEKYLNKSFPYFFNLSSFWLYTEYLLCSNKENKGNNIYKRYDEILKNIIQILNKLLNNNNTNVINYQLEFNKFISNVPLYNKTFIDFITNFHKLYLDKKADIIDEELTKNRKMSIFTVIPYLENMKNIYINIINDRNLIELKDKEEIKKNLLENFLIMSRNKSNLNAKALQFIFKDIYSISKYEEDIIKEFANEGLEDIKKLSIEERDKIDQRFFFYFFLCGKNKENITKLPGVYSEVSQQIKEYLNGYIEKLIKGIDQFSAEGLIDKCDEKSEDIVISVIKNIYGNPKYKWEKNIEDEKLYRNIKYYYMKYCPDLTRGVIVLANKMPINDFFTSNNFILNKITQYEKEPEKINDIFEQLNSTEANKKINANNLRSVYNYYDNIEDKIVFYILYYYQNIKKDEFKNHKDLMIKFHIKKMMEKNSDTIRNEINNLVNNIKIDNNINLMDILTIYDNYRDIIKSMNIINSDEINNMYDEFDRNLIVIINEKLINVQNNKYLEAYFNKLSQENKISFKDKILKNISSQVKGSLDLILFGDI